MSQSDYAIKAVTLTTVFIVDLDRGNFSVTNDAENVVSELNARYPNKRIVYRDSMGCWDELVHENGIFAGFKFYKDGFPFPK